MMKQINQINYHFEMNGDGPPLLFLHGFTGSTKTWEPFIPFFSKHYCTMTLDIIGHGLTDAPANPERYSMQHAAHDIATLLDELNIDQIHLHGYSMGGRLALGFACTYPERIASLSLESSSPGLASKQDREDRVKNDETIAQMIEQEGITAFVDYWESIPLFHTQKRVPLVERNQLRRQRLSQSERGLANSLRGMGTGKQPSLWDQLSTLSIPILLLVGEDDPKFVSIAQEMESLLPDARVVIVPNVGHAVHFEAEEAFRKIVFEFLQQVNHPNN